MSKSKNSPAFSSILTSDQAITANSKSESMSCDEVISALGGEDMTEALAKAKAKMAVNLALAQDPTCRRGAVIMALAKAEVRAEVKAKTRRADIRAKIAEKLAMADAVASLSTADQERLLKAKAILAPAKAKDAEVKPAIDLAVVTLEAEALPA